MRVSEALARIVSCGRSSRVSTAAKECAEQIFSEAQGSTVQVAECQVYFSSHQLQLQSTAIIYHNMP